MSREPDWNGAIAKLGADWGICQPTVKNYSSCGHTFAAVDAALALRAQGIDTSAIRDITVATYGTAIKVAGNRDPRTEFEAKFSTSYCIAAALHLGSVRLRAFEPDALRDPVLRDLAAKVTLEVDPEYEAAFPGRRAARVVLTTENGATHRYERLTRKGDPDDPMTDKDLSEKFADLAEPVLGSAAATALQTRLWALAE